MSRHLSAAGFDQCVGKPSAIKSIAVVIGSDILDIATKKQGEGITKIIMIEK